MGGGTYRSLKSCGTRRYSTARRRSGTAWGLPRCAALPLVSQVSFPQRALDADVSVAPCMPLQEASEMFASIALGTTVPPKELNSGVDPNSVAVNVAPQEYQQYVAPAPQPAPTYVVQEQPQQMQFLHTLQQPQQQQQQQQYPPQYSAQFVVPSGAILPRRTVSCDRSRPCRPRPDRT